MARGRRATATDTTPGKILALALVACAPIAAAFIVAPMTGARFPFFEALVLFGTPIVGAASFVLYIRAAPERRAHRASRIGALLAGVAIFLWGLVALSVWLRGGA